MSNQETTSTEFSRFYGVRIDRLKIACHLTCIVWNEDGTFTTHEPETFSFSGLKKQLKHIECYYAEKSDINNIPTYIAYSYDHLKDSDVDAIQNLKLKSIFLRDYNHDHKHRLIANLSLLRTELKIDIDRLFNDQFSRFENPNDKRTFYGSQYKDFTNYYSLIYAWACFYYYYSNYQHELTPQMNQVFDRVDTFYKRNDLKPDFGLDIHDVE